MTVNQAHILRVPSQVLTIQRRIVDSHILTLPERILRDNFSIVNLYILTILEYIFGITLQSIYIDILREHEGIGSLMQLHILQFQAIYLPESFVGIVNHHVLQLYVLHLTEELRAINRTILHHQIVGVPDGRTRTRCKIAAFDFSTIHVPPRVFSIELAIVTFHVLALLDTRLSIYNCDFL